MQARRQSGIPQGTLLPMVLMYSSFLMLVLMTSMS